MKPPKPHDPRSRESLARSIAREVQSTLPTSGSVPDLAPAVETSLREQSVRNEIGLAWVRSAGITAVTAVAVVGWLKPSLVGARLMPGSAVIALAAFTAVALAVLLALRTGWYDRRLRQLLPAFDALLIGVPVLLMADAGPAGGGHLAGVAALAAIACSMLVLSGAVRLSRTAQRLATSLAIGTWLIIAGTLSAPVLLALFVAALMIGIASIGTRFVGFTRSVVTREVADARLRLLYDDARSAIDAREEVLQIVAHDLRNPLSTIGMTVSLLRDLPADDEAIARYLGMITRCSQTMNRIIQDLLDVARMESGRLTIEPAALDVVDVLATVEEMMAPIAAEHGVSITRDVSPALPGVHADAGRVHQVFSNLIGNAVKFTPRGGRITLRARGAEDFVRLSVVDTGPGIPPERVARLFERFWQANAGDRRGIGLGLAIARSIVEAHGGQIGVESRPGGGSEFWFTLPVDFRSAPAPTPAAAPEEPVAGITTGS